MFEPITIDATSVEAIHPERRGKHDKEVHPNKSSSKPKTKKFKGKGKGKYKKTTTNKNEEGKPTCTYCKKEAHNKDHCWKFHLELKPKKYGGKGSRRHLQLCNNTLVPITMARYKLHLWESKVTTLFMLIQALKFMLVQVLQMYLMLMNKIGVNYSILW